MTWQINYALENIHTPGSKLTAEHLHDETVKICAPDQPDVISVISAAETIDRNVASQYHKKEPDMDFLCGYRVSCIWHGDAITYLRDHGIGWGSFGTLTAAATEGNANSASHKTFAFSDRLLWQYGLVTGIEREFDRVYRLELKDGRSIRLGMVADYEPTADVVRSFWDMFGPVDVIWNINPNGNPPQAALDAGRELGCEVMKWEGLKTYIKGG